MTFEHILVDQPAEGVGRVQLNRPRALNALNAKLRDEMLSALHAFDSDPAIGAAILTGDDRAFAAGADIKEMDGKSSIDMLRADSSADRIDLSAIRKPVIAAVSGYALGGGCELAMSCDMIVASETAVFGQPEINLGILPGAGGTQRLIRAVGKALAMEIILTDRRLSAEEALSFMAWSIASRPWMSTWTSPSASLAKLARRSQVAVRLAKEAVNKAHETSLSEGLDFERRQFLIAFASDDKAEGMRAFVEKRKARWTGR